MFNRIELNYSCLSVWLPTTSEIGSIDVMKLWRVFKGCSVWILEWHRFLLRMEEIPSARLGWPLFRCSVKYLAAVRRILIYESCAREGSCSPQQVSHEIKPSVEKFVASHLFGRAM